MSIHMRKQMVANNIAISRPQGVIEGELNEGVIWFWIVSGDKLGTLSRHALLITVHFPVWQGPVLLPG